MTVKKKRKKNIMNAEADVHNELNECNTHLMTASGAWRMRITRV